MQYSFTFSISSSSDTPTPQTFRSTWFVFLLLCDSWQDEEHPEVDSKEEDDLKDDLPHDRLPEVEGTVHHHGPKLDQHHDQERPRNLVL